MKERKTRFSISLLLIYIVGVVPLEARTYQFIDDMANEPFFTETKLDLNLRNRFKYLNENEVGPTWIHTVWGQAIDLDYQSGLWKDIIGFDVSYISVSKLAASDYFATRELLWNDGSGFNAKNAKGFNTFYQRYVKLNLGHSEKLNYKAKVGWQSLNDFTILKSEYELSKNSYLGYTGTLAYDAVSFDTLYISSTINKTSPEKTRLLSEDSKPIDYIASAAINYKTEILSASYAYGVADNFIERNVLEMSYMPHSKLTLGTQIYGNMPLSEYNELPTDKRAADGNAWHYAVDAKWQQDDVGVKLGIAYTDASKNDNTLGFFDRNPVRNVRWRLNSMTSAAYHYQRDGEVGLTALIDYKYAEDFYSAIQFNYGQFDYKKNKIKTGEINIVNAWEPSDPRLKNFSIFTKIGKAWLYQTENNRVEPHFNVDRQYIRRNSISADIIFDYKFNIL